jgi:hypothetical protein
MTATTRRIRDLKNAGADVRLVIGRDAIATATARVYSDDGMCLEVEALTAAEAAEVEALGVQVD